MYLTLINMIARFSNSRLVRLTIRRYALFIFSDLRGS